VNELLPGNPSGPGAGTGAMVCPFPGTPLAQAFSDCSWAWVGSRISTIPDTLLGWGHPLLEMRRV